MITLFPTRFSPSMLGDVWGCEMKFFRKYCQRYIGMNSNPHLIAGSNFASACELVRKLYYDEGKSSKEAVREGQKLILKAEHVPSAVKSNERLSYTLKKYFTTFPLGGGILPCVLQDGTHAIEYEFELDLGIEHPEYNTTISLAGKLDGLYEEIVRGKSVSIYVLDEKTTGSICRVPFSKSTMHPNGMVDITKEEHGHKMDGQFLAYHAAAQFLGIATTETVIRKVPILKEHEDAFELRLPVNKFMVDAWFSSTLDKICELKEKYEYYKKNNTLPIHKSFYPVYNNYCHNFKNLCVYNEGCSSQHGEDYISSSMEQKISIVQNDGSRNLVPLATHKKNLEELHGLR